MMRPSAKTVAKFMRLAADMIDNLSDEELNNFIKTMPRKPRIAPASTVRAAPRAPRSSEEIAAIGAELERAPTREFAVEAIKRHQLGRQDLITLGRTKSTHITKQDTLDHIREKVVEAFVGERLSSIAIRGESPRGL